MKRTISGQAALLTLLVMAVVLTVVLSISSRSLTDIVISEHEESAQRAFSAAEAGIERALIGASGTGSLAEANYSVTVADIGAATTEYALTTSHYSGDSATVWFISHDRATGALTCTGAGNECFYGAGSSVRVCWGATSDTDSITTPALELTVYYDNSGPPPTGISTQEWESVYVARAAYDIYTGPDLERTNNQFLDGTVSDCTITGKTYPYQKDVSFVADLGIPASCLSNPGCLLALKIRWLYNTSDKESAGVRVMGGSNLPVQAQQITSVGTSGEATRKLVAIRNFPELPPILDSGVFSQGISK